jgi:hypothetical protein
MADVASEDAKFPATFVLCASFQLSSEDNALIENSKDSVTNNDSNTNMKIVNLTLGYSLLANGHIIITCDSSNTPSFMHPDVLLRLALHTEGIGNQDKRL